MQHVENGWAIVCGVLLLVLLVNFGLVYPVWRRRGKWFRKPIHGLRFPWDEEEEAVSELHKRVLDLTTLDMEEPTQDDG